MRLTPIAPPSCRRKLLTLAACGISAEVRPRIAPRLSAGMMVPMPIRPMMTHSISTSTEVPAETVAISTRDAAMPATPAATRREARSLSARRPATGIVIARARPAGSMMNPDFEGEKSSAACR